MTQQAQNLTGYGPRSRLYYNGDTNTYQIWETRFLNYLYTQNIGINKAILPKRDDVEDDEDFAAKNRLAYAELVQVLDERSLQLIMNDATDDGRAALKILRQHYVSTEKPRILTLYEQLTTLKLTEDEDIVDYIIRAENTTTGLRTAGEKITDNLVIAMLLKGLPDSYTPFIVVHTQLDKCKTLAEFKASLVNYNNTETIRTRSSENPSTAGAMFTKTKPYTNSGQHNHQQQRHSQQLQCTGCGKGHASSQCRDRYKLQCNYCMRQGHVEEVCFKKQRARGQPTQNASANAAVDNYNGESYVFTLNADIAANSASKECIMVDCGATSHIVNDRTRFINFDPDFKPNTHYIQLADGNKYNNLITARGTAAYMLESKDGAVKQITLTNALLAPSFPTSLFSVRAAVEKGATVAFSQHSSILNATDGTQFTLQKQGQLYFLPTTYTSEPEQPQGAYTTRSLNAWHKVLGHMNVSDLKQLPSVTKGMRIAKSLTTQHSCTTCHENKMTRLPKSIDDQPVHAKKVLERVHSDLCGPIEPTSQAGHRYVISFTDEYSSMLFTYCLRSKSDATTGLKRFLADIAPIGQMKELHTDGGGEFMSEAFKSILLDHSIKHTTTCPYSSYQNGKAERGWRSLLDMARCLITDADLPKHFWSYAVKYATYLRNRSYQRRTGSTAYELFTQEQPDMRHLHTFGTPCTYYVDGAKPKLNARGHSGTYLGINPINKGYFILTASRNKVLTTRNVVVNDIDLDEEVIRPPPDKPSSESNTECNNSDDDVSCESGQQTPINDTSSNRPRRETRLPPYLKDNYDLSSTATIDYACSIVPRIPNTYEEAIKSPEAEKWKAAMNAELSTLRENNSWEVVPLPDGRTQTKGKWVFTLKQGKTHNDVQFKARYVACGYSQKQGIDYDETFSPTTRFTSIRALLQKAANEELHIHQMDVKGAYLNAPIDKEIYVQQPIGFEVRSDSGRQLSCLLRKSLYGLKQSGRNWHHTLTEYLRAEGFEASKVDPCTYTKSFAEGDRITLLFWVDDILIAGSKLNTIQEVKNIMAKNFRMDDRGELKWFLGIDFSRTDDGYIMSQERYINNLLEKFNMSNCNAVSTPAVQGVTLQKPEGDTNTTFPYREGVGSLIYLMTGTRPDISWITSKLSQYLSSHDDSHIAALKRVFRYLKGTLSHCIKFTKNSSSQLTGYADADWANDVDDRRSTTGYVFTLGDNGTPISWSTKKQPTVALSSCEAEYMALADATKEMLYLRSFITSIGLHQEPPNTIFSDNQGAIALTSPNKMQHKRTKHIDIRYHFIREQNDINYCYVNTAENIADILTKPLGTNKHADNVNRLRMEGVC